MKLTNSQKASVTIIAAVFLAALQSSFSEGHIDKEKFAAALIAAALGACRSYMPAASGKAPTDTPAGGAN